MSGLEPEVALVALWGEGIEYVDGVASRVRVADGRRAEKAVGLAGSRMRLVSYWEYEFGCGRADIAAMLAPYGMTLHAGARTVPKGAAKRLATLHGARGIQPVATKPLQALEWRQVGHVETSEMLAVAEIEDIHWALERDFAAAEDPISPAGVKSMDLLESAAARPATAFVGEAKYQTAAMRAAALVHSLIHNHPFHNGNKRTAVVSMLVFLDRNDYVLDSSEDDLYRFFLRIAAHGLLSNDLQYESLADSEVLEIAQWISQRSHRAQHGERIVPWRTLQRILRDFGCEVVPHRFDKLKISRRVVVRAGNWFRAAKERELTTYYTNTGDGREVPKSVLKRIRAELELDEEHNVDSGMFYATRREPDAFIAEYAPLLRRLARV